MLIDLINQNDIVSFNSNIAVKIGLQPAIYLSELLRMYTYAIRKNKLVDSYFTVDRSEIYSRTTLTEEDQNNIDLVLVRLNIIVKRSSIVDPMACEISLNTNNLVNIFTTDDEKINKDIVKIAKAKTAPRMSQRDKYKMELKSYVRCSNNELLQAYRDWIEGVYSNPKGFLSRKAIEVFQETVDKFANSDLDLALKIVEIATINGYRDATWAINVFNKDYKTDFYRDHPPVAVSQQRKVDISSEVF